MRKKRERKKEIARKRKKQRDRNKEFKTNMYHLNKSRKIGSRNIRSGDCNTRVDTSRVS